MAKLIKTPAAIAWQAAIDLAKKKSKPRLLISNISIGEETLVQHLRAAKLSDYIREYKFHPTRRWRFDFAWTKQLLAVEIEGGTSRYNQKSRHTSFSGFANDTEKYNEAVSMGWRLLRFTTDQVKQGVALLTIEKNLKFNQDFYHEKNIFKDRES